MSIQFTDYFKSQSKKLFKDWETHTKRKDKNGLIHFVYHANFFNIKSIFKLYAFDQKDEETFSLMKAQHLIAQMLGFDKWETLINASDKEQELAYIILKNCHDSKTLTFWWCTFNDCDLENFTLDEQIQIAKNSFEGIEDTELFGETKNITLKEQAGIKQLKMKTKVHCIHCDKEFFYDEAKVCLNIITRMKEVKCKYFPNCDGTIIDFM